MILFNNKEVVIKRITFDKSVVLVEYTDKSGKDWSVGLYNDSDIVLYLDGVETFTGNHSIDKERHDLELLLHCEDGVV